MVGFLVFKVTVSGTAIYVHWPISQGETPVDARTRALAYFTSVSWTVSSVP